MDNFLEKFEKVARNAVKFSDKRTTPDEEIHPFDSRDIHHKLSTIVKNLFDDGHYTQATFEAFKFVDKEVQRISGDSESGFKLMMRVFQDTSPVVQLTPCTTISEKNEQKGYQFIFAGSSLAIRNPRGHEYAISDDPDTCLDHLSLASLLLRRLEKAGYNLL